jgi:hypothetical protein
MGWNRHVLSKWDETGIADGDTTKIIELPQGVYASIYMRLSGTGGAGTPAVDAMIATCKVKTDKGYILDLRSADMQKLARALTGRIPTITNASGAYTETSQVFYFGRFVRDKALMLDIRSSNVRQIELTFGTLIAATAWATGTVKLTVMVDEWIGSLPAGYRGFISAKEVENKTTGTGKAVFDLFSGNKLAGIFLNIGTITTIRQVRIGTDKIPDLFGVMNFRDLVNQHNAENNVDTAETVDALWRMPGYSEDLDQLPNLNANNTDYNVELERGATTSTSRLVQLDVVS